MLLNSLLLQPPGTSIGEEQASVLWSKLLAHQVVFLGAWATPESHHLLLAEADSGKPPSSDRNRAILEQTLLGVERKALAFDFAVSVPMVAQILRHSLIDMGLTCTPARKPLTECVMARFGASRTLGERCRSPKPRRSSSS